MDVIGQATITSLLGDLEEQLNTHNATHPAVAEDSEEGSQSSNDEGSQSSTATPPPTPPLHVGPRQEPGFDVVGRARAWLQDRWTPAKGGGGKENQAFNKL